MDWLSSCWAQVKECFGLEGSRGPTRLDKSRSKKKKKSKGPDDTKYIRLRIGWQGKDILIDSVELNIRAIFGQYAVLIDYKTKLPLPLTTEGFPCAPLKPNARYVVEVNTHGSSPVPVKPVRFPFSPRHSSPFKPLSPSAHSPSLSPRSSSPIPRSSSPIPSSPPSNGSPSSSPLAKTPESLSHFLRAGSDNATLSGAENGIRSASEHGTHSASDSGIISGSENGNRSASDNEMLFRSENGIHSASDDGALITASATENGRTAQDLTVGKAEANRFQNLRVDIGGSDEVAPKDERDSEINGASFIITDETGLLDGQP